MSREMKHSGIEWIGEIPKEWSQYRIKYNTFLKGRIGWQGLNSNDFIDEGYCLITGTDFDNKGGINWDTCYRISKKRFDEDELLHVKEGDLLMTKDGTVGKMAIIKVLPEEASLNSHLLIIRQLTNLIDNSFLYWAMLSDVFKGFCMYYQSGTIMSSISQSTLGFFACYCPPFSEQQKIVNYLDKICGEVDDMIALQEQMIEELKAYKQSVITEAVTKGLNPNVPMKDSGIDWIGEVPEHWEIVRLKALGGLQNGISQSGDYFGEDFLYPFVSYPDVYKNMEIPYPSGRANSTIEDRTRYSVREGDVLFTRTSETIEEIGFAATCINTITNAVFSGFLIRFRPNSERLYKGYSKYYFRSNIHRAYFVKEMNLVTRASLSQDLLKNLFVLIPFIAEQQSIASYLDTKCAEIDDLIAIKQSKIEELKEYKKSVIYEYVTGKKEVV